MLGVAYKKDIDDLRESPSLTIIEKLKDEGCEVFTTIRSSPRLARDVTTTCR